MSREEFCCTYFGVFSGVGSTSTKGGCKWAPGTGHRSRHNTLIGLIDVNRQ